VAVYSECESSFKLSRRELRASKILAAIKLKS
jgi:hypothetical protein